MSESVKPEPDEPPIWISGEINHGTVSIRLADYTVGGGYNRVTMLTCLRCGRCVSSRTGAVRFDALLRDVAVHEGSYAHAASDRSL